MFVVSFSRQFYSQLLSVCNTCVVTCCSLKVALVKFLAWSLWVQFLLTSRGNLVAMGIVVTEEHESRIRQQTVC